MSEIVVISHELERLEKIVRDGISGFIKVGNALSEIKQQKKYAERGYESFEDYAQGEFGIKKTYAYDLIKAAKTDRVSALAEKTGVTPTSETQMRELEKTTKGGLLGLPAKEAEVVIWAQAVETYGPKPTVPQIREAATNVSEAWVEANPTPEGETPAEDPSDPRGAGGFHPDPKPGQAKMAAWKGEFLKALKTAVAASSPEEVLAYAKEKLQV